MRHILGCVSSAIVKVEWLAILAYLKNECRPWFSASIVAKITNNGTTNNGTEYSGGNYKVVPTVSSQTHPNERGCIVSLAKKIMKVQRGMNRTSRYAMPSAHPYYSSVNRITVLEHSNIGLWYCLFCVESKTLAGWRSRRRRCPIVT